MTGSSARKPGKVNQCPPPQAKPPAAARKGDAPPTPTTTAKKSVFSTGVDSNPNDVQRRSRNLISAEDQRALQVRYNTQGLVQTIGYVSLYNPSQAVRIVARLLRSVLVQRSARMRPRHGLQDQAHEPSRRGAKSAGPLMTPPVHHYI